MRNELKSTLAIARLKLDTVVKSVVNGKVLNINNTTGKSLLELFISVTTCNRHMTKLKKNHQV